MNHRTIQINNQIAELANGPATSLTPHIHAWLDRMQPLCQTSGIELVRNLPAESVPIPHYDLPLLELAFCSLVSTATRHAPSPHSITAELRCDAHDLFITLTLAMSKPGNIVQYAKHWHRSEDTLLPIIKDIANSMSGNLSESRTKDNRTYILCLPIIATSRNSGARLA